MALLVELVILAFLFCATVGVVDSDDGKLPLTNEMKNLNFEIPLVIKSGRMMNTLLFSTLGGLGRKRSLSKNMRLISEFGGSNVPFQALFGHPFSRRLVVFYNVISTVLIFKI